MTLKITPYLSVHCVGSVRALRPAPAPPTHPEPGRHWPAGEGDT